MPACVFLARPASSNAYLQFKNHQGKDFVANAKLVPSSLLESIDEP